MEQLAAWAGDYPLDSTSATLFNQFLYELAYSALHDELGDTWFPVLISTRAIDAALPRLAADADSPWWNTRGGSQRTDRTQVVRTAWHNSLKHLRDTLGDDRRAGVGQGPYLDPQPPLGEKAAEPAVQRWAIRRPGTHEVPNNLSAKIGPAPWPVTYGPSTRRLIDFADAGQALTSNPVGRVACPSTGITQTRPRGMCKGGIRRRRWGDSGAEHAQAGAGAVIALVGMSL